MRVFYVKHVLTKIMEAVYDSHRNQKTIDYIVLTGAEYDALRNELRFAGSMLPSTPPEDLRVMGVDIRVEN